MVNDKRREYVNRNRVASWRSSNIMRMFERAFAGGRMVDSGLDCSLKHNGWEVSWGDGCRVIMDWTQFKSDRSSWSANKSAMSDWDRFVDGLQVIARVARERGWPGFSPKPELL